MEDTTATAERPEYLTVEEAAEHFRVSAPTIYRRCADGTLPHVRIGIAGPIRIPLATLEHLENSAEHTPGLGRRSHDGEAEYEANPEGRFTKGAMRPRSQAKTAARGYGSAHQARRRRWAKRIYSGEEVNRARCGYPILPGQAWDLGHVDGDKSQYQGPEHRRCNRQTATHKAKQSRRRSYAYVDEQPCKVSRQW